MRATTSDREEAALCVITSSATCALHLGIAAAVLPSVQMTVGAHHAQHVVQVDRVKTAMVTGAAHLAMPELNAFWGPNMSI